jgi:hypothetical protein
MRGCIVLLYSKKESSMNTERIERAIERAHEAHRLNVVEPPRGLYVNADGELLRKDRRGEFHEATAEPNGHTGAEIIRYIREGLGWVKDDPYLNSWNLKLGGFSWCGAFAAWCDIELDAGIRKRVLPSTYRLYEFCRGTERDIPLDEIQRGDIVIVGSKSSKRWGQHITRALEVTETHVHTIEGNAHGRLGDSSWGEGVVTRRRPFKGHEKKGETFIMFAYRFIEEDYA